MDAYAPPAMLQQAQTPPSRRLPVNRMPFEGETATIARLRDRWEKVVGETAAAVGEGGYPTRCDRGRNR
jgi:hypothetical protein